MTEIAKSHWVADGERVRLSLPFAKVDQDTRTVSGFATLDNIDSQDDIVTAEASQEAFALARGNLREMHQPIAVGHMIDFTEEEMFTDGNFFRGVFVKAYVSKGAADTWEKVLDGTLTGFSIGGKILESSMEYVPELDKTVRFITKYELIELSLVDNPANPLANIFSIQKTNDGALMVKGMLVDTKIENVFACEHDTTVKAATTETMNCPICHKGMNIVGWFESGADVDRTEKVREILAKSASVVQNEDAEGGVDMAKEMNKSVDEEAPAEGVNEETEEQKTEEASTDEVPTETDAEVDEAAEVVADDAAEVEVTDDVEKSDEATEEDSISKALGELKESIDANRNEHTESVASLKAELDAVKSSFETEISKLNDKFGELNTNLDTAKAKLAALEDSLAKYNDDGALKKSGDVESTETNVQKNDKGVWNGAFSTKNLLNG